MTETEIFAVKHAVRARDGFCCTACGMTQEEHLATFGRDLEVHRLTPDSPYTEEGCVTLCRSCHAKKPKRPRGSGYNGRFPVSLRPDEYQQLQKLADRNNRPLLWQLRLILHDALKAEGLWPPPGEDAD